MMKSPAIDVKRGVVKIPPVDPRSVPFGRRLFRGSAYFEVTVPAPGIAAYNEKGCSASPRPRPKAWHKPAQGGARNERSPGTRPSQRSKPQRGETSTHPIDPKPVVRSKPAHKIS